MSCLDYTQVLGMGNFGKVVQATACGNKGETTTVAVKMLKDDHTDQVKSILTKIILHWSFVITKHPLTGYDGPCLRNGCHEDYCYDIKRCLCPKLGQPTWCVHTGWSALCHCGVLQARKPKGLP